jgi:hypothetical protein
MCIQILIKRTVVDEKLTNEPTWLFVSGIKTPRGSAIEANLPITLARIRQRHGLHQRQAQMLRVFFRPFTCGGFLPTSRLRLFPEYSILPDLRSLHCQPKVMINRDEWHGPAAEPPSQIYRRCQKSRIAGPINR